jgi:hypothetical protein
LRDYSFLLERLKSGVTGGAVVGELTGASAATMWLQCLLPPKPRASFENALSEPRGELQLLLFLPDRYFSPTDVIYRDRSRIIILSCRFNMGQGPGALQQRRIAIDVGMRKLRECMRECNSRSGLQETWSTLKTGKFQCQSTLPLTLSYNEMQRHGLYPGSEAGVGA